MGNIKAFLFGIGTAYGIYLLTKKRSDGSTLLEDIMNNPGFYARKAGSFAIEQAVNVVEEKLA